MKAIWSALLVTICLTGCHARGPAPQELLDRIKASVETDARQSSGATFTVESIKYSSTLPLLRQAAGDIPAGTVMYYYEVRGTRTDSGGSPSYMRRLFYVYPDSAGNWQFMENKTGTNYGSESSLPAAQ